MIVGNADLDQLANTAPTIEAFCKDDIEFSDVTCFQLIAEMRKSAREAVLPACLHPTIPAALSIQAYRVGDSPWGSFQYVTVRVSCRSGVRARGYTTATIVDKDAALEPMREQLGYPATIGDIAFRASYDGVALAVDLDGTDVLDLSAIDPEPMGLGDIQYTGTLNLAHTPKGLRILQIEANDRSTQVDRLKARINHFDSAAWGNALLDPYFVVAASIAKMSVTIPAVRFVLKPDELAFTGTEAV